MQAIDIKAYAKVNLSLDVICKREDGYHDIESVMQGIGMHDNILVMCGDAGCDFASATCELDGKRIHLYMNAEGLEPDESNLAVKGVKAMAKYVDMPEDLSIIIDKKLPIAAGIAGGSGNAAASMLALNAMLGNPLSLRHLMRIGIMVGADVPFSIMMNAKKNEAILAGLAGLEEASVAANIGGIGEVVEPIEPINRYVIMANPGVAVSTREVYEAIDSLPEDKRAKLGLWGNVMEAYTLAQYPEAARLKAAMEEQLSADKVLMSGSGPTIVAYYTDKDKWLADCKAVKWVEEGWGVWPSETGTMED